MLGGHAAGAAAVPVPEPEIEWLFYQSLAGVWPADLDATNQAGLSELHARMEAYMLKAVREAKLGTSWASPSTDYEEQVTRFVRRAFASRDFLADFHRIAEPLFVAGAVNSLSQLAMKLAAPGVPDIYFGTELWDLSLVDPDNRRPVDFVLRQEILDDIGSAQPEALLKDWRSGRAKLRLLQAGLTLRRARPKLFAEGDYIPLEVTGDKADHVVAFARHHADDWLITVATRLPLLLLDGASTPLVPPGPWTGTRIMLPARARHVSFRNVLTGEISPPSAGVEVAKILSGFPAVLLFGA
jgi:(1->4)-alpha-D-glucan 1-alpha-D-glucosylmutase